MFHDTKRVLIIRPLVLQRQFVECYMHGVFSLLSFPSFWTGMIVAFEQDSGVIYVHFLWALEMDLDRLFKNDLKSYSLKLDFQM